LVGFVQSITAGQFPGATLDDGLRSLEVVLSAEESSRTGRPVAVGQQIS
jgi:hypothetical protein